MVGAELKNEAGVVDAVFSLPPLQADKNTQNENIKAFFFIRASIPVDSKNVATA